jgi:transcription elongation factor GreA
MQVPKRRGEWKNRQGLADEYLTPVAIAELKTDLERLEKQVLPKAVDELARTREMGDLSENAAYSEAKGRVLRLQSVIFQIKERIKHAIPIKPGSRGNVHVGSKVVVEVFAEGESASGGNGKQKSFQIFGTQQIDPSAGHISFHSPVGAALMGKKTGEVATVIANGKTIEYTIVSIT